MNWSWRESKNGNPYINYRGFLVTIFKQKKPPFEYCWSISNNDIDFTEFSAASSDDIEEIKDDAIERVQEIAKEQKASYQTETKFDDNPVFDEFGNPF